MKFGRAFTLVELLVVITIIAVLAAILFPVFSRAKAAAKTTDCLAKNNQLLKATMLYVTDSDGHYPQSRKSTGAPWVDDASGSLEEPDYGSIFPLLNPYIGAKFTDLSCPEDPDPKGIVCQSINPDVPNLASYIYNGNFAFGLNESSVDRSSQTVIYAERRSNVVDGIEPFCNYMYRPWFNQSNPQAPEDDMDATAGAVATQRHNGHSIFGFVDGHTKNLAWAQTFDLAANVNLHKVQD
ncbi:MAG: prepilin-type N-terminal cleavage/methylation domain-containing protein [Armatimonadetes bacterium]|nr:prepilin-type N-terminal cleavage/methylation domain-containing protein [Armatimonadota bacterium]